MDSFIKRIQVSSSFTYSLFSFMTRWTQLLLALWLISCPCWFCLMHTPSTTPMPHLLPGVASFFPLKRIRGLETSRKLICFKKTRTFSSIFAWNSMKTFMDIVCQPYDKANMLAHWKTGHVVDFKFLVLP